MEAEAKNYYRLDRLKKYVEIEVLAAEKDAGSKRAYFELLSVFSKCAPSMTAELAAPSASRRLDAFLAKLGNLQQLLLNIGASSLVLDAEKTADYARAGDATKCAEQATMLAGKIRSLCSEINAARIDPAAVSALPSDSSETAVVSALADPSEGESPKVPIDPVKFEDLCRLVENFESDEALRLIHSLKTQSYADGIDAILAALYNDLIHFDHEDAMSQTKRLRDVIRKQSAAPEKTAKKKILAVDDKPDILNTVKTVLKEGYAVYGVTNHMAALKFLTNNGADLVLLDIDMPDMNGFELLGIIRKMKAYETTPVIFLTGSVSVENILKSRKAGGTDFIKKPIDALVLWEKIRKYLE